MIDLLNLPADNKKLLASCEEYGFFRVINHGMPMELQSEMKEAASSFFNLPDDVKLRSKKGIAGSRSIARANLTPHLETFGVQNTESPPEVNDFCSQLELSPHHKEVIKLYASKAHRLAVDIATNIAASMGLDRYSFDGWSGLLRPNKYSFSKEMVGSIGVVLHTDSGFMTLLQEDESVGGLEIMDKSGALVAVEPVPGSLLVILGDVAKAWSNGRLQNAKHRVICKEGAHRITIPLFLLPPSDGTVEPPAAFVDSEHPQLYQTFSYQDYKKLMISTSSCVGEALSFFTMEQAR